MTGPAARDFVIVIAICLTVIGGQKLIQKHRPWIFDANGNTVARLK